MSKVVIVQDEGVRNTDDSNPREPSNPGLSEELDRAERYGALEAEYRQSQERIAQLEARLLIAEATAADVAQLRSELAQLRAEVFEMEEEIEEEADVTLVTPEPEPAPAPEPPPEQPKESVFSLMLRL